MPELPEVETIVRGLARRLAGENIESVWIGPKPEPLKSPAQEIAAVLDGATIAGVRRAGKHIVFDLSGRGNWIIHLGMTGRILLCPSDLPHEKHTHLVARLGSGGDLRFVDPRRFGRLSVVRVNADGVPGFDPAGTEPLDVGFESFASLFRGRHTPIKSALLNQKLLRGVGNIYADESLFRAGVRPRRRAHRLTRQELRRLYRSLQKVLNEAIAAGGSSISDYVDSDGDEGLFQFQHRVYGRTGKPCLRCRTPIKRVIIAGRSSHYCPRCQK
jgi:formamidopyrimidine-DNA glycosylase